MRVLALAAEGTRDLVAAECRALGLPVRGTSPDGVELDLDEGGVARALVGLAIATRLLLEIGSFAAHDATALYDGAMEVDWTRWLDARSTFAVHASGDLVPGGPGRKGLDNHIFVALKVKDALADRLTRRWGHRPDVDKDDPDVRVVVRGRRGHWTIYLDLSGQPLHERGYREAQGPAPLKETLAAALAAHVAWKGQGRLHDAMCGSGTWTIETVNRALGIAPGCTRWFGVERWPHHGRDLQARLDEVRGAAVEHARRVTRDYRMDVRASDIDDRALDAARRNLEAAGLGAVVQVSQLDATRLPPPPAGTTLLANVPYGERIGGPQVQRLYRELGERWKTFHGSIAWILEGNPDFVGAFGLPHDRAIKLRNGPLDVVLRRYSLGP